MIRRLFVWGILFVGVSRKVKLVVQLDEVFLVVLDVMVVYNIGFQFLGLRLRGFDLEKVKLWKIGQYEMFGIWGLIQLSGQGSQGEFEFSFREYGESWVWIMLGRGSWRIRWFQMEQVYFGVWDYRVGVLWERGCGWFDIGQVLFRVFEVIRYRNWV